MSKLINPFANVDFGIKPIKKSKQFRKVKVEFFVDSLNINQDKLASNLTLDVLFYLDIKGDETIQEIENKGFKYWSKLTDMDDFVKYIQRLYIKPLLKYLDKNAKLFLFEVSDPSLYYLTKNKAIYKFQVFIETQHKKYLKDTK